MLGVIRCVGWMFVRWDGGERESEACSLLLSRERNMLNYAERKEQSAISERRRQ